MEKIVIGMSGGVDSTVAAYLLKKQGYDVVGVTMVTLPGEMDGEGSPAAEAKKIADELGIEHHIIDFTKEFKQSVIDYFVAEYLAGRTPNPCVMCNKKVKWDSLITKGKELGATLVATGHYGKIDVLPNGRYAFQKASSAEKDQTYVLYGLTQEQLKMARLPLGEYTKDEIRGIAADLGLDVAHKKDSQENCFIPDNDYGRFITEYTGKEIEPGNFVDKDGKVLGQHKGIIHYTIGQRKGLNISLGKPAFVVAINKEKNEVVLGDNEDIFNTTLYANQVNFMSVEDLEEPMRVWAKIRYNHKGDWATIEKVEEDKVKVTFEEPVRAITAGQSVVFYDGEYVLGGGTIL